MTSHWLNSADAHAEKQRRNIGDRVFVSRDNYGSPATIIAYRNDAAATAPQSHYMVRQDDGQEFWTFDFELSECYDSTSDTIDHIGRVRTRLHEIIDCLAARSERHDVSKFGAEEKPGYDIISEAMRGKEYGTPEYSAAMGAARQHTAVVAAIEHHYAVNDHHPEHWADGIAGMSLLSLTEMIADWKGASERNSAPFSIEYAINRFGIDPQLAAILRNTVKELGW